MHQTDKDLSARKDYFLCFFCFSLSASLVNQSDRPMGVLSKAEVCGNLCQCQHYDSNSSKKVSSDNLFSPIKNKMKVLKKIKKRMGLGRFRSSGF